MSLKDRLSNLNLDQVKDAVKDGIDKAKEMEAQAEKSQAGERAKDGLGKLGNAARSRFGKS